MAGQGFPGGPSTHGCDLAVALEDMQKALESQSQVTLRLAARLSELRCDAETFSAAAPLKTTSSVRVATPSVVVSPVKAMTPVDQVAGVVVAPLPEHMSEVPEGFNTKDNVSQVHDDQQEQRVRRKRSNLGGGLFASADELKEQIRHNLQEEPYNVTNFFKETGPFQAIARAHWFEVSSLALVIASSLWMGVDLDLNKAMILNDASVEFQVAAHLICFLFLLELVIRVLAFKHIKMALKDFWCVFDLVLVIFMVVETWLLSIAIGAFQLQMSAKNIRMLSVFRMLRLVRVLRLAKLFRFMPELLVIIRGIAIAMRAISLVFALLGIIIYIAAIIFRLLLEDTALGEEQFSSVPQAMGTLLLDCALSGTKGGPIMHAAWTEHPIYALLFFCFALLANVTMMGILGGLLVQTIKKVAEVEEEEKAIIRNLATMDDFWKHIVAMDENNDGFITLKEFFHLLQERKTVRLLKKMDVDPEALVFLSDFVFGEKNGRLTQQEFNHWVLELRGTQKATLKDHMVTRKVIVNQVLQMAANMNSTPDKLSDMNSPCSEHM